jgi:cysteine desulfuration protein SufE
MTGALEDRRRALVEGLLFLPDPQERLAELVRKGARHQLPTAEKNEANRVSGCVSAVWLTTEFSADQRPVFRCDADSPMVKGLVACLCDFYSGLPTGEIAADETNIWRETGLMKVLSPTRLNGLAAARDRIKRLCGEG